MSYALAPPGPYDPAPGTPVTVTATLTDGWAWGDDAAGWTGVNPATATFTVELAGTTCDEVTPVAPTTKPGGVSTAP